MRMSMFLGAIWFALRFPLLRIRRSATLFPIPAAYPLRKEGRLVLLTGYTHAGKTTLALQHPVLRTYARLCVNDLHDFLNGSEPYRSQERPVGGAAYWAFQYHARWLRYSVLRRLLASGRPIVLDGCHLQRRERKRLLALARVSGYQTAIVWVTCPEGELLRRLRLADAPIFAQKKELIWEPLYRQVQRRIFESPQDSEGSWVIPYDSGDDPGSMLLTFRSS